MSEDNGNHSADKALQNYREAAARIREKSRISADDIDVLITLLLVYVDHSESDGDVRSELVKEHQQIYERFYAQNNA